MINVRSHSSHTGRCRAAWSGRGPRRLTVRKFGRLDVLVNNAIALSPNVVLEDKTDDMLDGVL